MEKANEEVIKAVDHSQNTQMHGSSFYCWHCCQMTLVHQDCLFVFLVLTTFVT